MLIVKEAFQPLNHLEQLLVRVFGLQHELVLAGVLAFAGCDDDPADYDVYEQNGGADYRDTGENAEDSAGEDDDTVAAHRSRALSPDHPVVRGTAQNPDVFFQGRETVNPFYEKTPEIVQDVMDQFAKQVGRSYHLFDYVGAPEQLSEDDVLGTLKPLLEDAGIGKIGQNLIYDSHVFRRHGMPVDGWRLDTMVAAFLLISASRCDKP